MPPEWFSGWRRGQKEAVDECVDHFENGVPLVILDAPTGTGKTLIGESVREALQTKGLYLCSSLTLQDQFIKDFPYAADLRGRSNYIPHLSDGRYRSATCADCDKTDGPDGQKACTFCDPVWNCPYEVAKRKTLAEDLGSSNIRYFLTEANHVGRFSNLPFVILDECDVLEGELMGFVEATVTNSMRKLLGLPMPRKKTRPEAWLEWLDRVIPQIESRLEELTPTDDDNLMEKRRWATVNRLLVNLKRVAPQIADGGWVYTDYHMGSVTFKPVQVAQFGEQYLWRHSERWLAMSATIISPEEFVESLGYEGPWECVRMDSPFDKARRPIKYAPVANMAHAEQEVEWPKMASAIRNLIDMHPDERILVHTVSYLLSKFLVDELADQRVKTYLDRNDREKAISWFEETSDGVLLAPSLDRGYDGADDLVRVVVVCKLPFPNIGDKQISTRLFKTPGGGTWYAVQTARSLVQMAGRGMRHEDDWCTVYVLDKQMERFWREWKKGGVHRLLPSWFTEAIVWGGTYRRELVRAS